MAEADALEETPDTAMDRIEAALQRIAHAPRRHDDLLIPVAPHSDTTIIAARLDGLIARLRDALAVAAG